MQELQKTTERPLPTGLPSKLNKILLKRQKYGMISDTAYQKSRVIMYILRNIDEKLAKWALAPDRQPLLLRGARQVGKTQSIRHLAASRFRGNLCEINFERNLNLKQIFLENLDPKRILRDLETISKRKITPGQTLLFFDEIQESQEAIKSLRYFFEELPELHVIAAGSLLEFALGTFSFPVGRVAFEFMYPMSFTEFLRATRNERLIEYVPRLAETNSIAVTSPMISDLIRSNLKEYFVVGGMPAAVVVYVKTGSFQDVKRVHETLMENFSLDCRKYARGDKQIENIERVLQKVFCFVGKHLKYSGLIDGDQIARTKKSLHLLEKAMLVHLVKSVNPAGLPLSAEASDKHFKCIFLDIGLGQFATGLSASDTMDSADLLNTFQGQLAEQFVGQQLLAESATASEQRRLYCWMRLVANSSAEVDYVLSRSGKIVPVEVKSGKSGRLKSLHMFMSQFGGAGICLQDRTDIVDVDQIRFAPLYSIL